MGPVGDATMATAEAALRGLSVRADVRADNLANVNTPGFRAGELDFESTLKTALRDGRIDADEVATGVTTAQNMPGPNGNLVSVEDEMVGMMKDQLLRTAMVNAYNFKVTALRTAMGSR